MVQHRDLVPLTVYLPSESKKEAEQRASEKAIPVGTLLRQILLGIEKPL